MHTGPIPESDGELSTPEPCARKCGKCRGPMIWQNWESSCGGYEDSKYTCTVCGAIEWVDGIDS